MEDKIISRVFFVRHGASVYKEYFCNEKELDLIPKGEKQIKRTAKNLEEVIDRNLPILIVSSPRIRTMNSAVIIKEYLESKEVKIISEKIFLRRFFEAIRFKGPILEGTSRIKTGYKDWLEGSYKDSMSMIESPEKFIRRVKHSFKNSVKLLRRYKKPEQIILVSHGEIMDGLLLTGFHFFKKYNKENTPRYGEIVEIQIFPKKVVILFRNKEYVLDETKIKLNPLIK